MKQSLYVSLDSLLDTRFGTLIKMDEEKAAGLIAKGYRQRQIDDFSQLDETIDNEEFKRLYESRDQTTLELSKCSNIVPTVCHMVMELRDAAKEVPFIDQVTVDVNMYPYDFSEEVQREIVNTIRYMTGDIAKISAVNIPLIGLMPDYISNHYDAVIMYDFNAWLEKHGNALKHNPMPRVSFIVPALFQGRVPTEDELDFGELNTNDPFSATEMALAEYLIVRFVDVSKFSVVEL
tara:strand:- start:3506 stop:4210 length:705 start_codon:yes stop_codon:yes gene_type:complete